MGKILVADDEKSVRMLACSILRDDGHEVLEAQDGKEALDIAGRENPDVILLDIRMPVMDGLKACKALKTNEKTKNIPVLVLTALEASKEDAIKAGTDDFVNKPFEASELIVRVRSMLKIRNITNELDRTVAYLNELHKKC